MKATLLLAALCALTSVAPAAVLTLDMATLPSAQGWTYSATGASHGGQIESNIWSTNGTTLSMNTMGSTLVSPSSNLYVQTGIVNTTDPIEISWRSRILQHEGGQYGWTLGVTTGVQQFYVGFQTNSIALGNDIPIAFDATGFHDYRIEATPGAATFSFFVDNVSFASGGAVNVAVNRVFFGDGTGAANASAEMTAYTFNQAPEPSCAVLLAGSAFVFFGRRPRN